MGASASGIKAAEQPAAESLLTAFKTLSGAERRRHASVLNYWLSVRGDREFPPLHDLDPLQLSDAGPSSILLELISGGHDAEIRHLGEALREEAWPERIIDAPNPSVLSCIAKKLPIVAISRDFLAFEDEYETAGGKTHCSVTLLPLSAGGAWVDYVYALVSVEQAGANTKTAETGKKAKAKDPGDDDEVKAPLAGKAEELEAQQDEEMPLDETAKDDASQDDGLSADESADPAAEPETAKEEQPSTEEFADPAELETAAEQDADKVAEADEQNEEEPAAVQTSAKSAPGFSKLLDSLAGLTGFYGSQPVKVEAVVEPSQPEIKEDPEASELADSALDEPTGKAAPAEQEGDEAGELDEEAASEPVLSAVSPAEPSEVPSTLLEGSLQNKLTQVRAKADEARAARMRANAALYEGLGAAYDFALDAEDAPEEYLRLVEAQGLKIQLRSPMKPVVKLAFAGTCDEPTIKQLEAVLAWAFEEELPRGTLAERIEAAGGIGSILKQDKAA